MQFFCFSRVEGGREGEGISEAERNECFENSFAAAHTRISYPIAAVAQVSAATAAGAYPHGLPDHAGLEAAQ